MNQRRTIMGSCDYSLEALKQIKIRLMDLGSPNHELNWAIGGLICALSSYLLKTCEEVFKHSASLGEQDARKDLELIKSRMNEFIDDMLKNHN